jgi:eukaryotic-like serine/threonine-protein kinase
MGVVYEAEDTILKRRVALKLLPAGWTADPRRLERFQREAQTVAALNHPNIVTIHSVEEAEGIRFLTMELILGASLDHRLRPGGMPLREMLDVGIELTGALAAAHEKGIVHRDLKPANVMVTKDGRVKVLDFGLAKLATATAVPDDEAAASGRSLETTRDRPLTIEGEVVGTAAYMSPEQVQGRRIDHRTDIFSLGVMLYELATGGRPFRGESRADLASAILRDTARPVHEMREELPRDLGRIIARCLQKDPEKRFQSARDVHNELRDLREEVTSGTPPGGAGVRPRQWTWPALGLLFVLLVSAALWIARGAGGPVHSAAAPPAAGATPATAAPATDIATLAVLPFTDMSREQDQEYFADGLAEEILNSLARLRGLRVTGRTSSFMFKGKSEDLRVVGRKLNVGAVLEGSVRKTGKRVRITAQLVNAADGFHLWSESYDRELNDIFAVQEEIARSVAEALKVTLLGSGAQGQSPRTESVEAYDAFLQAEYFFQRGDDVSLGKAFDGYQQAIRLYPGYAAAWAGLSEVYSAQAFLGARPEEEGVRSARDAAEHALTLDPDLASAHRALGYVKMKHDWDWSGADAEFQRALALDPSSVWATANAGRLDYFRGRLEESLVLLHGAVERDPLDPLLRQFTADVAMAAGRLDEAEAEYGKALELSPEIYGARDALSRVYLLKGMPEAALDEIRKPAASATGLYSLALVYHALGRRNDADAALRELTEKFGEARAYQVAAVYAYRGEPDRAFEWLERAYVQRDPSLTFTKVDPFLRGLAGDPRYVAFLEKMHLPA